MKEIFLLLFLIHFILCELECNSGEIPTNDTDCQARTISPESLFCCYFEIDGRKYCQESKTEELDPILIQPEGASYSAICFQKVSESRKPNNLSSIILLFFFYFL